MKETKLLSKSEEVVMKAIWDLSYEQDSIEFESVTIVNLREHLEKKYNKPYVRTTVVTFLQRLEAKGAVKTYRIGRMGCVLPQYSQEEYEKLLLSRIVSFWYEGCKDKLIHQLEEI